MPSAAIPSRRSTSWSAYQDSSCTYALSRGSLPVRNSLVSGGRSYGLRASSPISTTCPVKPSSRSFSAAFAPARLAPTITKLSSRVSSGISRTSTPLSNGASPVCPAAARPYTGSARSRTAAWAAGQGKHGRRSACAARLSQHQRSRRSNQIRFCPAKNTYALPCGKRIKGGQTRPHTQGTAFFTNARDSSLSRVGQKQQQKASPYGQTPQPRKDSICDQI